MEFEINTADISESEYQRFRTVLRVFCEGTERVYQAKEDGEANPLANRRAVDDFAEERSGRGLNWGMLHAGFDVVMQFFANGQANSIGSTFVNWEWEWVDVSGEFEPSDMRNCGGPVKSLQAFLKRDEEIADESVREQLVRDPGKKRYFLKGQDTFIPLEELDLDGEGDVTEPLKQIYKNFLTLCNIQTVIKEQEFMSTYKDALTKSHNIILHGAPGTGKTYMARQIAEELTGDKFDNRNSENSRIGFVQFHPSYDYTDFVEGLRPVIADGSNKSVVGFELRAGIFKQFVQKAMDDKNSKYVFIIDEINRGDISRIFGELFFSIDPGYRGPAGGVDTQYSNMHDKDKEKGQFYIPENVYIIGTMNDIDRSVDTFDFAMRRRFRFMAVKPTDTQKGILQGAKDEKKKTLFSEREVEKLILLMNNLNSVISDKLGPDYQIGASYFTNAKTSAEGDLDLDSLRNDYILPLLNEYVRGNYDKDEAITAFKAAWKKSLTGGQENASEDSGKETDDVSGDFAESESDE